jgi:predicted aspartyl protease
MVGRIYRALTCTEYLEGKRHPAPALKLTLYNVIGEKILENLKVPIDTGYEGSIMLTTELYQAFQIAELPRTLWRNYRTLTGAITMRIARAIIEIDDMKFECFVESPLFGKGKLLIGRELLNRLTIIMHGERKQTCIGKLEASNNP